MFGKINKLMVFILMFFVLFFAGFNLEKVKADTSSELIAFTSNRSGGETSDFNYNEIYVMDADGENVVKLTDNNYNDCHPSFSYDGSKLVFESWRDGNHEIYIMNNDGSNQVNLTNNGAADGEPAYSPAGNKIVFSSDRNDSQYEIYTMNMDGTNVTRLTTSGGNYHPAWSPNGSKIAYESNGDIYVMDADGSNNTPLVYNNGCADTSPAWSPDGTKIAYSTYQDWNWEIYVVNADGTNPVNISKSIERDFAPSWSPDGSKIIYHTERDGYSEVYYMNMNGKKQTRLTLNSSLDEEPVWASVLPVQSGIINKIACGAGTVQRYFVKSDGTVWQWYGYITPPSETPRQVAGLSDIIYIGAGRDHALAVKSDGTVWAWGNNTYGQLGFTPSSVWITNPVQVSGLDNVIAVDGGRHFSLALKADGTVWAWGKNNKGQHGNGTYTDSSTPIKVSILSDIKKISTNCNLGDAGGDVTHCLALKNDGTVWSWGVNTYGELGDGTTTSRNIPVQVANLTSVIDISGCDTSSMALKADGTVWAWGAYGTTLRIGPNTYYTTPMQVNGLSNVKSIACGWTKQLALKNDNSVWQWDYAGMSQILVDCEAITAGSDQFLALKNDGTLWQWGKVYKNGTATTLTTPEQVNF